MSCDSSIKPSAADVDLLRVGIAIIRIYAKGVNARTHLKDVNNKGSA